jgi:hypothetical protein
LLAESQAREKVLRDALGRIWEIDMNNSWSCQSGMAKEALALPSDSTALDSAIWQAKREVLLEAADYADEQEAIKNQGEPVGTVRLVEVADNYSMNSRHMLEVDLDVDLPIGTKLYTSAPTIPEGMVLVKKSAVDWLQKYKPVLCEKSGLSAAPKGPQP